MRGPYNQAFVDRVAERELSVGHVLFAGIAQGREAFVQPDAQVMRYPRSLPWAKTFEATKQEKGPADFPGCARGNPPCPA